MLNDIFPSSSIFNLRLRPLLKTVFFCFLSSFFLPQKPTQRLSCQRRLPTDFRNDVKWAVMIIGKGNMENAVVLWGSYDIWCLSNVTKAECWWSEECFKVASMGEGSFRPFSWQSHKICKGNAIEWKRTGLKEDKGMI